MNVLTRVMSGVKHDHFVIGHICFVVDIRDALVIPQQIVVSSYLMYKGNIYIRTYS